MSQSDQDSALQAIGNVSTLLRKAIGGALLVAPEQYLTITIPGTVIDLTAIENRGTYVYDTARYVTTPTQVQQAEGKLVDGMMQLANIMIGDTGKSISRSYARALDTLIARRTNSGSDKEMRRSDKEMRRPGQSDYEKAMTYLNARDLLTGLTAVEIYSNKQQKWASAQDAWDEAKFPALKRAKDEHPSDDVTALQDYNDWNQTHFRRFDTSVQAEWMDWVANGDKYNVEYSFGVVDVDSIMARIELRKESMRNSAIIDVNGANEVQEVQLKPKRWATMCSADGDTQSQSSGTGTGTDIAAPGAEYANPIFGTSGGPNANSGANPSAPTTDNPWTNIDLSFSAQDQKKSQDEASWGTATGCKISFTSLQIIGWVSQILPALPRDPKFESMIQNVVP